MVLQREREGGTRVAWTRSRTGPSSAPGCLSEHRTALSIWQLIIHPADINASLPGYAAPVLRKFYDQSFHTKQKKVPEQKLFKIRQIQENTLLHVWWQFCYSKPTRRDKEGRWVPGEHKGELWALQTLLSAGAEELTCLPVCGCDKRLRICRLLCGRFQPSTLPVTLPAIRAGWS